MGVSVVELCIIDKRIVELAQVDTSNEEEDLPLLDGDDLDLSTENTQHFSLRWSLGPRQQDHLDDPQDSKYQRLPSLLPLLQGED